MSTRVSGPSAGPLVIQWPRFGPYHLARLRATHERLAREGRRLVALETASSDSTYEWREERAAEDFERVQVFGGVNVDSQPPRRVHRAVTEALDRIDPAAVAINSYSNADAHAALLWCRRHGRTAVLMMESKADDVDRTALRERLKATIVAAFDSALAGGTPQRLYLGELGFPSKHVFVPYDVVDNQFFASGAARVRDQPGLAAHLPGLGGQRPFFLASGRFVARKNFDGLLKAYASYRQHTTTPWDLVLLGDGPCRASLAALASATTGVTLAGFRQIEELPSYYALAGAFVHVAFGEPWGLVINEAMATGLPVIASTATGAAADLVLEGESGFLCVADDHAGVEAVLERMSSLSPEARAAMGQRSREIVAAWSPERFADGLVDAMASGATRASRPAALGLRALLWSIRTASPRSSSFHTLKE